MEQRAINVRYMLQNLISTLQPLIIESKSNSNQEQEEDFVVVEKPRYRARDKMLHMMTNSYDHHELDNARLDLFSYFSVSDLGSTLSTICSSWTTWIQQQQLVHGGQKTREERWKCWTYAINRRKSRTNRATHQSYASLVYQAQNEEQEARERVDSSFVSKKSSNTEYTIISKNDEN